MRLSALPDFRKLYGRIDEDLDEGTYHLKVRNNYDVSDWNGEKYFVLTTTSGFGGKNQVCGALMMTAAGM
jgi:hypothetical protein